MGGTRLVLGIHLLSAIGIWLAAAQPAPAQVRGAGTVIAVPVPDRAFRTRFQELLLDSQVRDHGEGWRLARDVGRPVAPLLWDLHDRERSDVRRRLILLVAASLAGGVAEDERLLQALEQGPVEEKVLGAMLLALGPRRPAGLGNPWQRLIGRQRGASVQLQVAAYLASSRFGGGQGLPAPASADPGLVAAASLAGVPGLDRGPWFGPAPGRHAELVWRGVFLARADAAGIDPVLVQRAQAIAALTPRELLAGRRAAALLLGQAGQWPSPATVPRPPWELLEALTEPVAGARALREWLGPVPQPLDEDPRRLAVAYARSRPPAEVIADAERWLAVAPTRRLVVLALCIELLGAPVPAAPPAPTFPADLPEAFWIAWALGQPAPRPPVGHDPLLEPAVDLAVDGRLSREAARRLLEEALWRSEAHPGFVRWQAQRDLVRDLLLTGSSPGLRYLPSVPLQDRYLPDGLRADDPWFVLAVECFEFLSRPALPLPPELRLP